MRVAIDTNFLFDLATDSEIAIEALEVIRKRLENPVVVVPPTVLEELMLACKHPKDERERTYAPIAMQRMITTWKFQPVDLVPVGHGIVAIVADKIRERGYLPHEECNDAYILAEAALIGCALLVTSDAHMLNAPVGPLKLLFEAQDVTSPLIVSPRKLAKEFFR
jgi:predicted nucleic acid-binding protein